jgi:hypothetical protein
MGRVMICASREASESCRVTKMSVASISLGWRKIKADLRGELTETSVIGSIFSVAAAVLIVFLVYSQVS